MPTRDIIVIGASAGGVDALQQLMRGLPADLPAAVFVVLHLPAHGPSVLPRILARAGRLPALHPHDRQPFAPGTVYVAPPDYQMCVKADHLRLTRGPRENGHRPAADALFRTAARNLGRRVIGVVLSGALDDGTAGLAAIKQTGGVAVVQHPDDALYAGMPQSALNNVAVDYCLPVAELAALLTRLVAEPLPALPGPGPSAEMAREADMAELEEDAVHDHARPGAPSVFGCPECGGVLWELHDGDLLRFRCRVGHAWSAESLLAEQSDGLEAALWAALRALEEQATLAHRMAERATTRGFSNPANYTGQANDATAHAEVIRRVLLARRPDPSTQAFDPAPPNGRSANGAPAP